MRSTSITVAPGAAARAISEGERLRLLARGHPLPLGPQVEVRDAAEVAAVARGAEAAERRGRLLVDRAVVHVDHAGVELLGDRGRAPLRARLHRRDEPVVRLVRELDRLGVVLEA